MFRALDPTAAAEFVMVAVDPQDATTEVPIDAVVQFLVDEAGVPRDFARDCLEQLGSALARRPGSTPEN